MLVSPKLSKIASELLNRPEGVAACEVAAHHRGCKAYAAIYAPVALFPHWSVRRFELPTGLVDDVFDFNSFIECWIARANALEDAVKILSSWGVDTTLLGDPQRVNYPKWGHLVVDASEQ